ncbi:MAG: Gfo/Idh/MocA family oxidoreductase [Gaiella sp.]|nr:Gfo/Idh/MocA family oxidoreductase [Gaiella sp.]
MGSPPVRIGIIGLGDIAVRAHMPAIGREPGAELVVAADQDPSKLAAILRNGVRTTADPMAVLRDPTVDAVVLATPAAATARLARAAVEAGKWVLAEKPLATSVGEAAALRDVPGIKEHLQIGLTYRHHPAVDRLRDLVAEGTLGRPLFVQASICDEPATPLSDPAGFARRLRSLEQMPPIISDGVHACDRILYILGDQPVEVSGFSVRTDPAYATANINGGTLRFADGSLARLEVVWLTPVLPASEFVITGPHGKATLDPPTFGLTIELNDGTTETIAPPGDKTSVCFSLQLASFVNAVRTGRRPTPGLEEAIESLALAERIAHAAGLVMAAAG